MELCYVRRMQNINSRGKRCKPVPLVLLVCVKLTFNQVGRRFKPTGLTNEIKHLAPISTDRFQDIRTDFVRT